MTQEFNVGDVVKRKPNCGGHRDEFTIDALRDWGTPAAKPAVGDWHHLTNLELVTAATPEPRPFQVGDVVRTKTSPREHVVSALRDRGNGPEVVMDEGEAFDYPHKLVLVSPAFVPPARKLGETPEPVAPHTVFTSNIAINDPRIAWIWKDLATYADGKNWCSDYDELAKVIGIPGRKKKWSGAITVAGTQRLRFDNIEADTMTDAENIFRTQVAAELNGNN